MKLELYYFEACPFCVRVLEHIKRLGLQDSIEYKDILKNPELREKHVEKTGRATVPCLYIDEKPLFESDDIMQWLDKNKSAI